MALLEVITGSPVAVIRRFLPSVAIISTGVQIVPHLELSSGSVYALIFLRILFLRKLLTNDNYRSII